MASIKPRDGEGKGAPRTEVTPEGHKIAREVRYDDRTDRHIDLAFETFGSPKDPAVVLVMGLGSMMEIWDDTFCELLAKRFFVVRFDNRDIGLSSKIDNVKSPGLLALIMPILDCCPTPEPYTLDSMAMDMWALVDHVVSPGARVHVVGQSMGGMIAQCAALLAPERTITLTSIFSTTNAKDDPEPSFGMKMKMAKEPPPLKKRTPENLADFRIWQTKEMFNTDRPMPDEEVLKKKYIKMFERSMYQEGLLRQVAAIRRAEPRDVKFKALPAEKTPPALVIHGDKDLVVPIGNGVRTAESIKNCKYVVIEGMEHYLDDALIERVTSEMTKFIDEVHAKDPAS